MDMYQKRKMRAEKKLQPENEKMLPKNSISWFPGHMARTKREITENLKLVDAVVEVLDARIPFSSKNPDVDVIIGSKPKLILLNKSDLADDNIVRQWASFYAEHGVPCIPFSVKQKPCVDAFYDAVYKIMQDKIESWRAKGILHRDIRLMIVGIPNVGKSAIINRLASKISAKVENRPGVTRRNQWFSAKRNVQILDTPGVLWPKFGDNTVAYNLAFSGAIKDQILDIEDVAVKFLETISKLYINNLCERFKFSPEDVNNLSSFELLEYIGRKRGMMMSGGQVDTLRTSNMILDEFRSGKLGKLTLECPESTNNEV